VLAGFAAAAVLLGIFFFVQTRSPGALLEVIAVHGAAVWSNGAQRMPLVVGARLPETSIETESETATVEVRLADGSQFTMHGSAEAAFSDHGAKQVTLKRGKLTASVAPQRAGHPLRVRTPTAHLEVLGTVFSLEAAPQRMSLSVSHGRVRLRRLVDGREVEVGADQHVAASLVSTDALVPQAMDAAPAQWRLEFARMPERFTGTWIAANGIEPAHIAASPIVNKREADGAIYVHHGIIIRSASNSPADVFALLGPDSILRVRLRMKRQFPLQLMLSTRRPDGSFAGNFELVKLHPQILAGAQWQTLELPIREMVSLHPERVTVAAGNQANVVILTTLHESVGLEVEEISIRRAASAD
jgi:hypothetical protein